MPRAKPKPKPKRGKKKPATPRTPAVQAELTQAAQEFTARMKLCTPRQRQFILAKLDGANTAEAARRAGYSEKTARSIGAQLLTQLNVDEAIQAGWSARGFGPQSTLAGISEMVEFDPGELTSYVNEIVVDYVERRADEVLDEVRAEIIQTRLFMQDLQAEEAPKDEVAAIAARIRKLRSRELDLTLAVGKNEHATVLEETERLKRVPYIDLEKVQEAGKTKFITGVKHTPQGRNIELISRKDVLDMAGRAHGIFREERVHTGPGGGPIQTQTTINIEELTGEQIAQLYAETLGQADES